MKKIGIITLNGYVNYGNRLQNYALQEVLLDFGFCTKTIIVENNTAPRRVRRQLGDEQLSKLKGKTLQEVVEKLLSEGWNRINRKQIKSSQTTRTQVFRGFTQEHIKETEYGIADNSVPDDLADRYDFFVTGSDQVWNPDYIHGSSIYFLTFAPKKKRIAFSPSFGVSEIKPEFKEKYKEWISGIHRLSVREDDGAKIIKELTGRDASVLVDPTLLLTKERWLAIAKEATHKPHGKYLLTYFLGKTPDTHKKQIKRIARENQLKVVNLADIRDREAYETGPSEFIDYIDSCSLFCTDSFHGAVFSILLEKPFIVYERMGSSLSMFSRINTLLEKFELTARKSQNISANKQIFDIDYSHIAPILEDERKRAFDYLKAALNI